jgi:hypothetical protein
MKIYANTCESVLSPDESRRIFEDISGKDVWIKVTDTKPQHGNDGWIKILSTDPFYYQVIPQYAVNEFDQFGLKIGENVRNGAPRVCICLPMATMTTEEIETHILGRPEPSLVISDEFSKFVGKDLWVKCYDSSHTEFVYIRIVSVDSDFITYYTVPDNIVDGFTHYGDEFIINTWFKKCPRKSSLGFFNNCYKLYNPVDLYSDEEITEFFQNALNNLEDEDDEL